MTDPDTRAVDLRPLSDIDLDEESIWALVDAAPDGMVLVDESGTILLLNRQIEKMFGYDRGDLLGRPIEELLPDELRGRHRSHRAAYRKEPQLRLMGSATARLRAMARDGTTFPVEISLSPLSTRAGTMVIAAVRDIRQRLATEQALASARARAAMSEDRERVARELHDTVIQNLFATGIALQGTVGRIDDRDIADRVQASVDSLDQTIKQVRTAIFGLTDTSSGLRTRVLDAASSASAQLGFEPEVVFDGPVDTVEANVCDELVPSIREALSNAARHAAPQHVEVTIVVTDTMIRAEVADDGRGMGLSPDTEAGAGRGLGNLIQRATRLGGSCEFLDRRDGGTIVRWSVPRP